MIDLNNIGEIACYNRAIDSSSGHDDIRVRRDDVSNDGSGDSDGSTSDIVNDLSRGEKANSTKRDVSNSVDDVVSGIRTSNKAERSDLAKIR